MKKNLKQIIKEMDIDKKLGKKVKEYVKRTHTSASYDRAKPYDLYEKGLWGVYTGDQNEYGGGRTGPEIYEGSYIGVVATMLENSSYYGFWVGSVNNSANGYVEKITPKKTGRDKVW